MFAVESDAAHGRQKHKNRLAGRSCFVVSGGFRAWRFYRADVALSMSSWEIIWSVVGAVAGLLAALGLGMIGITPAEFRGARVCFGLTAALLAGTALWWSIATTAAAPQVLTVDLVIGVAVMLLLPAALMWVNRRQRLVASKASSGSEISGASLPRMVRVGNPIEDAILEKTRKDLEVRRLRLDVERIEENRRVARGETPHVQKQREDTRKRLKFADTAIVAIGVNSVLIVGHAGGFAEWNTHLSDSTEIATALIGRFRPISLSSSPAFVTARIDYYDSSLTLRESVDYGCWLGETTRAAEFQPSDTRNVILVLTSKAGNYAIDDKRDDVVHEYGVTFLPLPVSSGFIHVHGVIEVEDVAGTLGDAWFKFNAPMTKGVVPTIALLDAKPTAPEVLS